jgi:hypothetical protein
MRLNQECGDRLELLLACYSISRRIAPIAREAIAMTGLFQIWLERLLGEQVLHRHARSRRSGDRTTDIATRNILAVDGSTGSRLPWPLEAVAAGSRPDTRPG